MLPTSDSPVGRELPPHPHRGSRYTFLIKRNSYAFPFPREKLSNSLPRFGRTSKRSKVRRRKPKDAQRAGKGLHWFGKGAVFSKKRDNIFFVSEDFIIFATFLD